MLFDLPATADRLSFNAATRKGVQGGGELLGAIADGSVKLDAIDAAKLPAEMQKLGKDELKARIDASQKERTELQNQVEALAKERAAYLQAENKRLAAAGKGDSFDEKVAEILRTEAAKKGIKYSR